MVNHGLCLAAAQIFMLTFYFFAQVGLLLFDSRAHLQWNLQDYPTKAELLRALNYVPYHNGPTQTDQALKYVTDRMSLTVFQWG